MKFELSKEISFRSRRNPPREEGIEINKFSYEWEFRDNNLEVSNLKIPLEVNLREEVFNEVAKVSAKVLYEISDVFINLKDEIEKEVEKYVDSQLKESALEGMCFKAYGLTRNSF